MKYSLFKIFRNKFSVLVLLMVSFGVVFVSIVLPVNVSASCMMPNLTPAEELLNNKNYDVYLGRVLGKEIYQQGSDAIESFVTFEIKKSKNPKTEKIQRFSFREVLEYHDPSLMVTTGHYCTTVWTIDNVQGLEVGEEYVVAVDNLHNHTAVLSLDSGLYWYDETADDIITGLSQVQEDYKLSTIEPDFTDQDYQDLKEKILRNLEKEYYRKQVIGYIQENFIFIIMIAVVMVGIMIVGVVFYNKRRQSNSK